MNRAIFAACVPLLMTLAAPPDLHAEPQSKDQQKCINAMNKDGAKVAATQGKENTSCIKNAGKGKEADPNRCLTRDGKGKVAKAASKTEADYEKNCASAPPDFGLPGVSVGTAVAVAVVNLAIDEELQLVSDVFGTRLAGAIVTDKDGAKCQAAVSKDYEKTAATYMKGFLKCKKNALKAGASSAAALEACVLDDPGSKAAATVSKLASDVGKQCADNLFPGACAGESLDSLAECVHGLVRCAACRTQSGMDGLGVDCDVADDDERNGSCVLPAVPVPTLEGPIAGNPFVAGTSFDLAALGYSQQEYFVSGMARSFTNIGELDEDGFWTAEAAGSTPYKTRILVYRPIDASEFNGSVVVEWLNVSGGLDAAPDWISAHTELTREGYVWVGVSAQLIGVEGGGNSIPGLGDLSLKGINPGRYGTLQHPGDSFSYDIFSQVGRAIRGPSRVDPQDGLPLERLIAVGESQSAFRLVTYVNAIDPLARVYDGFLIHSRGGSGAALSQPPQSNIGAPAVARIRTDTSVPVLTFQTETDLFTLGFLPDRQSDGPLFRLWEAAGTAHADTYTLTVGMGDLGNSPAVAEVLVTASPIPGIIECDRPVNSGPQHFVLKAAIAALNRWVRDGEAPASAPLLETTGSPPAFALDDLGNVRGGIRTPYVDAPVAVLSGLGQSGEGFCRIFGTTVPFDAATLAALYPDHQSYVAAVNEATDRAVENGFVLPADATLIKAAAESSGIGG